MKSFHKRLPFYLSVFALLFGPGMAFAEDDPAKPEAQPPQEATAAPETPAPQLSPAMTSLRGAMRQTLANHLKRAPSTQSNTPTEIQGYCLAFGCNSQAFLAGANGQAINGITCLCYNYPCAGREMLGFSDGRIAPRIGYGYQERPGEFLAMLALSRVKPDYPVRVDKDKRTVADLIEAEKLGCRSGADLSLKLIGLSFYVDEPEWKNDLGETWSIDRMIKEELAQPVISAPEGGLNRLMGLSYAIERREKSEKPIDGQYQRAQKFTNDFQTFALQLQNSDGSWGPRFLAARGANPDVASQLRSTGRVFEWLAFSLPDDKLQDAQVVRAAENLVNLLNSRRYQSSTPALTTQEIVSAGHALHGLNLYDHRVFKPFDAVEKKPEAESPAPPATADRDSAATKSR